MIARTTLVFCVIGSLVACGGTVDGNLLATEPLANDVAASRMTAPVSFRRPAFDHFHTGLVTPMRLLIKDPRYWAATWDAIVTVRPRPPVPHVDFPREMVVVMAMGQEPTGGYSIRISDVRRDSGGRLFVFVTETSAGACPVTHERTEPVDAVIVPRTEGGITFVEQKAPSGCGH
jgi:hypothetical protein